MIDRAIVGGLAVALCLALLSGLLLTVLEGETAEFVVTTLALLASLLCIVLALIALALRRKSRDRAQAPGGEPSVGRVGKLDGRKVTARIKKCVWPTLREVGFDRFTGRTAWRHSEGRIDVVNFQSFNRGLADGVGCTTFSFAVNLGCYLTAIPHLVDQIEVKEGITLPEEFKCPFRRKLHKGLSQEALERPDVWFVEATGENLDACVEDACVRLEAALPWFESFSRSEDVLRLLEEVDEADGEESFGFGPRPSFLRATLAGHAARWAGEHGRALEHFRRALTLGKGLPGADQIADLLRALERDGNDEEEPS